MHKTKETERSSFHYRCAYILICTLLCLGCETRETDRPLEASNEIQRNHVNSMGGTQRTQESGGFLDAHPVGAADHTGSMGTSNGGSPEAAGNLDGENSATELVMRGRSNEPHSGGMHDLGDGNASDMVSQGGRSTGGQSRPDAESNQTSIGGSPSPERTEQPVDILDSTGQGGQMTATGPGTGGVPIPEATSGMEAQERLTGGQDEEMPIDAEPQGGRLSNDPGEVVGTDTDSELGGVLFADLGAAAGNQLTAGHDGVTAWSTVHDSGGSNESAGHESWPQGGFEDENNESGGSSHTDPLSPEGQQGHGEQATTYEQRCTVQDSDCEQLCTVIAGNPHCGCRPGYFLESNGSTCAPMHHIAGYTTPAASQCLGGGSVEQARAWHDCHMTPHDPSCDIGENAGTWMGVSQCGNEIRGPLAACKCIYGEGVIQASRLDNPSSSATGCPVFSCEFVPCEGDGTPTPLNQCSGDPTADVEVRQGYLWSVPIWALDDELSAGGLYGDRDGVDDVSAVGVSVTWRQLAPTPGELDLDAVATFDPSAGENHRHYGSWRQQTADESPYWVRLFTSHRDWVPEWVIDDCDVAPISASQPHIPLWNQCVWAHLMDTYERLGAILLADARFAFMYIPGGFAWSEFGLGPLAEAARLGLVEESEYVDWFRTMIEQLASLFGDDAGKLVFTGEDHPYSIPDGWNYETMSHLPREAVSAGLGIRNGITERYNSHLNSVPAYGLSIASNGHVVVDEEWVGHRGADRVLGTENECYSGCSIPNPVTQGSSEHRHAVMLSNLKALQMRMNWIFVGNGSGTSLFPEHWRWVKHSLGRQVETAFDAWAMLREAKDTYWAGSYDFIRSAASPRDWIRRPWVRNMERWLTQRDVCGDGTARAGKQRIGHLFSADDVTYEGLQTDVARGQTSLYFDAHPAMFTGTHRDLEVHITYEHRARTDWVLRYQAGTCFTEVSIPAPSDMPAGVQTAKIRLPEISFNDAFQGATDFVIRNRANNDLLVYFVRVIRNQADGRSPASVDSRDQY